MALARYRFAEFELDAADRRLLRNGRPVELSARYLDALTLLVSEGGRLVSKDRFMTEVWRGVPVTDEALTQCIRSLRRALGDDAARPRFIETAPKHGYRFIAAVEAGSAGAAPQTATNSARDWPGALGLVVSGVAGGAAAGVIGGLIYGFSSATDPLQPGLGSGSIVLVLTCVTVLVAITGAFGVTSGVAAADLLAGRAGVWRILGGAAGGLIVGGMARMMGLDAFTLLLGQSPGDITGGPEGLAIGTAIGAGAWIAARPGVRLRRAVVLTAVIGAVAGLLVAVSGGRLLGGSLDLLSAQFASSRLSLAGVGALFGEDGFGLVTRIVTSALEGGLFSAFVVMGMGVALKVRVSPVGA